MTHCVIVVARFIANQHPPPLSPPRLTPVAALSQRPFGGALRDGYELVEAAIRFGDGALGAGYELVVFGVGTAGRTCLI